MGAARPHNPAARGELLGAPAPWRNRSQTKNNKPALNTKLRILPSPKHRGADIFLPAQQPSRQVSACFFGVAPIVEPAQFNEAVIGDFARQVVEGIAQKVDIAALPISLGSTSAIARLRPG